MSLFDMARRNNINGLPHNLVKSYFSTLRYSGKGYMGDWLLNAANKLQVKTVTLDIINARIDPVEMEKLPLLYHLRDLKKIIQKELIQNGFDENFIVEATIRVNISNPYPRTFYCYPELIDRNGRKYTTDPIIETAYEEFEPLILSTKSLWDQIKSIFK